MESFDGHENPPETAGILAAARDCFGAALTAAYLHGSAVAGGLQQDSDIDILLVIDRPMRREERRQLLSRLMRISAPPKSTSARRPLEVIVFTAAQLEDLSYPARSEFVYGEWLRNSFASGQVPQPETDPEYTILLAQAWQNAHPLLGPPSHEILPAISAKDIRQAIHDARAQLISSIAGDERNVLLTLARMWCTLETGDIVPKNIAAQWAIPRLSKTSAKILDKACRAYLGKADENWSDMHRDVQAAVAELSGRIIAFI